jgi:hypothetical protein
LPTEDHNQDKTNQENGGSSMDDQTGDAYDSHGQQGSEDNSKKYEEKKKAKRGPIQFGTRGK